MLKVGLTGGYATGKSFVASELRRLGCQIIQADKLGHEVLEPAYVDAITGRVIRRGSIRRISPPGQSDQQEAPRERP